MTGREARLARSYLADSPFLATSSTQLVALTLIRLHRWLLPKCGSSILLQQSVRNGPRKQTTQWLGLTSPRQALGQSFTLAVGLTSIPAAFLLIQTTHINTTLLPILGPPTRVYLERQAKRVLLLLIMKSMFWAVAE